MPQIFKRGANDIARLSLVVVVLAVGSVIGLLYVVQSSSYVTEIHVAKEQPVPFSHEHHVSGIGIDCRYCHYTVDVSSNANIPAPGLCMNCHKQVWADAPMLKPVRDAVATDKPLEWNKVHDLPDFVYFNHSAHVNKGVGCVSCHGRVDKMPLMWKNENMYMGWCLDCHRNPAPNLRPVEQVTNMEWKADEAWKSKDKYVHNGVKPKVAGHIDQLTNCWVCHR